MDVKHGAWRKSLWDYCEGQICPMEGGMCEIHLKDRKLAEDFMLLFSLYETIDQLAMTNRVHWYSDVLRMEEEDGDVLRRVEDNGDVLRRGVVMC